MKNGTIKKKQNKKISHCQNNGYHQERQKKLSFLWVFFFFFFFFFSPFLSPLTQDGW